MEESDFELGLILNWKDYYFGFPEILYLNKVSYSDFPQTYSTLDLVD